MSASVYIWCLIFGAGITQLLIAIRSSSSTTQSSKNASAEAQRLFEDFWQFKISQYPEYATFKGIHDNDELLNDMSETALLSRFKQCQRFLAEANVLQPSLTDETDILNMKILRYELDTYIKFFHLKGYYLPVTFNSGPHINLKWVLDRMPLMTYNDYEVAIKRLQKIPTKIDQMINLMKAGVESNITNHAISMKNLEEYLGEYVVEDPTESPLYKFFKDGFPKAFTPEQIADIQARIRGVILERVVPAYRKLLHYILNVYVTRQNIAVSSIHRGEEFYNSLISFHTSTNLTAKQIHNIGIGEVERIENEMMKLLKDMGEEGMTTKEFSAMIRDDPNNYFNTSEELIDAYQRIIDDRINPRLLRIFNTIPTAEVRVEADTTPKISGAYYIDGSTDGSIPGVFYVASYYLESQPKFRMLSLTLHESNPGHHFQSSYVIESPNFPMFRKKKGGGLSNAEPSRFPYYTAMNEGWALYAEGLGFDMDLYQDPLERFGHYNEEIFRAVRLVVDTGMHALGWTKDEAMNYMSNHTAFSRVSVENEIDRYIRLPGQALGYKVGQLKIRFLRAEAEARLGQHFNLKEFHDVILRSFAALNIVEEEVRKWVERNMQNRKSEPGNATLPN